LRPPAARRELRRIPAGRRDRPESAMMAIKAFNSSRNGMTEAERDLWHLIEVSKAISASLDLDKVLGLIIDAAISVLSADAAVIVLLDEHRRPHLRNERARRPSRAPGAKYSQSFIDQVLQTGQPQFVLDSDL